MQKALGILALLVAVVVLVVFVRPRGERQAASMESTEDGPAVVGPHGEIARSIVVFGDAEGGATNIIHVYEPVDGTKVRLVDLKDLVFRWQAVKGADRYLFLVNNEVGEPIWKVTERDTITQLPAKVASTVRAGTRIKWIVQAARWSASTDLHRVELLP